MSVLEDVEQLSFVQLEVKFKQDLAHVGLYVFQRGPVQGFEDHAEGSDSRVQP